MAAPSNRPETRVERKERTRRAILDAALTLCEDSSLVALSLRQVAKEVGIVPTAFYRHFESLQDLGLALVEESFVSLHAVLREVRRSDPTFEQNIDTSVETLLDHVERHHAHFLFITRERLAGPPAVRAAIKREIDLAERELATDLEWLVTSMGASPWSPDDWKALSNLFVRAMVSTVEAVLVAGGDTRAQQEVAERTRTQLRLVLVGALNWESRPAEPALRASEA
ncbi:MAG: TetR family transcriptional regulator [Nocardioides sp.]|nr:TetR family transcriptional regulator [Nocardioides sp.]